MLASGLANAVWRSISCSGCLRTLFSHFGGLLEKHLFLGRTLLLRPQEYQTCAGAGMLAPGLPNLCGAGMLAPGLANVVLAQHFVLGVFGHLLGHFGGLLEKHS